MTGATDLPALPSPQVFADIIVLPGRAPYPEPWFADGGPVWPDFEHQTLCRHRRAGVPADHPPSPPHDTPAPVPLKGSYVWGGYAPPHFGHFVAEHIMRLPAAAYQRPNAEFLFFSDPGVTAESLPEVFYQLCAWFGVTRPRVRLVEQTLRVERLEVWPQAEEVAAPPEGYLLPLLDHFARARGLTPSPSRLLFVTRAGMARDGKAQFLGESYLAQRLRDCGVAILDPATAPLREQLEAYAGAEHIVFSEGSAVHGRQLLGWRAQGIDVLIRRPGSGMGGHSMPSRCRRFNRIDVARDLFTLRRLDGDPALPVGLTVLDLDVLFRRFVDLGVDLRAGWDDQAYRRAQVQELHDWMAHHSDWMGVRFWDHLGNVPELLEREGWQDSLRRIRRRAHCVGVRRRLGQVRRSFARHLSGRRARGPT